MYTELSNCSMYALCNAVGAMHTVEFVESFSLPNLDCSTGSRQPISYLCSRWSRGHNSFSAYGLVDNWIFMSLVSRDCPSIGTGFPLKGDIVSSRWIQYHVCQFWCWKEILIKVSTSYKPAMPSRGRGDLSQNYKISIRLWKLSFKHVSYVYYKNIDHTSCSGQRACYRLG